MFYTTSDNTKYTLESKEELEAIKKHCINNGLKLFDSEKNEIVLIKEKKIKE